MIGDYSNRQWPAANGQSTIDIPRLAKSIRITLHNWTYFDVKQKNIFSVFFLFKSRNHFNRASLKSSDYYWPKPEPVTLRATGQVSTLTELEQYLYGSIFSKFMIRDGPDTEQHPYGTEVVPLRLTFLSKFMIGVTGQTLYISSLITSSVQLAILFILLVRQEDSQLLLSDWKRHY